MNHGNDFLADPTGVLFTLYLGTEAVLHHLGLREPNSDDWLEDFESVTGAIDVEEDIFGERGAPDNILPETFALLPFEIVLTSILVFVIIKLRNMSYRIRRSTLRTRLDQHQTDDCNSYSAEHSLDQFASAVEDLDNFEVSESAHQENLETALSALSLSDGGPESEQDEEEVSGRDSVEVHGTFSDEDNLALDVGFENDSVDSLILVPIVGSDQLEAGEGASESDSLSCDEADRSTGRVSVKEAVKVIGNRCSSSTRLPTPQFATTPRRHRQSFFCKEESRKTKWDLYESTSPHKCAVNKSPHIHIEAASGDRLRPEQRVKNGSSARVNKTPMNADPVDLVGLCGDTSDRSSTANSDVVSETTEWIICSV